MNAVMIVETGQQMPLDNKFWCKSKAIFEKTAEFRSQKKFPIKLNQLFFGLQANKQSWHSF